MSIKYSFSLMKQKNEISANDDDISGNVDVCLSLVVLLSYTVKICGCQFLHVFSSLAIF